MTTTARCKGEEYPLPLVDIRIPAVVISSPEAAAVRLVLKTHARHSQNAEFFDHNCHVWPSFRPSPLAVWEPFFSQELTFSLRKWLFQPKCTGTIRRSVSWKIHEESRSGGTRPRRWLPLINVFGTTASFIPSFFPGSKGIRERRPLKLPHFCRVWILWFYDQSSCQFTRQPQRKKWS